MVVKSRAVSEIIVPKTRILPDVEMTFNELSCFLMPSISDSFSTLFAAWNSLRWVICEAAAFALATLSFALFIMRPHTPPQKKQRR